MDQKNNESDEMQKLCDKEVDTPVKVYRRTTLMRRTMTVVVMLTVNALLNLEITGQLNGLVWVGTI